MSVPTNTTGQAAELAAPRQEAVMGKAIPTQHPAVVLRSHYRQLRALLAVAMIAVVGLTVAVVILANDDGQITGTSSAEPIESINYGGFNPATGRPDTAPLPNQGRVAQPPSTRYDGGPEEGSRGARSSGTASSAGPGTRYDGGPEEGSRGMSSSSAPSGAAADIRFDGGPEEGSRGPTAVK
jgi:hypothetical protein